VSARDKGCTSQQCEVSSGLRADRWDWLGGACAVVPNKLTERAEGSGQACGVAIVVRGPSGFNMLGAIRSKCVVALRRNDGGFSRALPQMTLAASRPRMRERLRASMT